MGGGILHGKRRLLWCKRYRWASSTSLIVSCSDPSVSLHTTVAVCVGTSSCAELSSSSWEKEAGGYSDVTGFERDGEWHSYILRNFPLHQFLPVVPSSLQQCWRDSVYIKSHRGKVQKEHR